MLNTVSWAATSPAIRQRGGPVRGGGSTTSSTRAMKCQHRGDLVFFQPHSAPGGIRRAFLEGRLTSENDLAHYRQEITAPAARAHAACRATRTPG